MSTLTLNTYCRILRSRFYSTVIRNRKKPSTAADDVNNIRRDRPLHVFKSLYPWKTKGELSKCLLDNIIYNQDGIIAINKPYGIPLQRKNKSSTNESLFSIEDCLTEMSKALGYDKITPAKITERFTSGVSLLTYSDSAADKIQRSYKINQAMNVPTFTYWAVTLGQPVPMQCQWKKVGMGWITSKDIEGKLPKIIENFSKREMLSGNVQVIGVSYRTKSNILGEDQPCLLEISVSSNKHHFLRNYLAHQLAPVLGDHLYGNRVQTVFGKRLPIAPVQASKLSTFQKVPVKVLDSLRVEDSSIVPNCIHLQKLTLSRLNSKANDVILIANPPPHFEFVCKSLKLNTAETETQTQKESAVPLLM